MFWRGIGMILATFFYVIAALVCAASSGISFAEDELAWVLQLPAAAWWGYLVYKGFNKTIRCFLIWRYERKIKNLDKRKTWLEEAKQAHEIGDEEAFFAALVKAETICNEEVS